VVATAILGLFLTAAAAPTPLYAVYTATWAFSATLVLSGRRHYRATSPA
jgi:hypothetical protein